MGVHGPISSSSMLWSTGSIFVSCPEEKMQFFKRRQYYPGYSNESCIAVKILVFYTRLHPNPLYTWSHLVIVTAHEISATGTAFFIEIKVQRGKESIFNTWKSRTKATVEAMCYSKRLPSELYCWTVDHWSRRERRLFLLVATNSKGILMPKVPFFCTSKYSWFFQSVHLAGIYHTTSHV